MNISGWRGLFIWNNHRLLTFKVNVLDHAAPDSVVIWRRGVQEQMALTDCNLPNREEVSACWERPWRQRGEREANVHKECCHHMGNMKFRLSRDSSMKLSSHWSLLTGYWLTVALWPQLKHSVQWLLLVNGAHYTLTLAMTVSLSKAMTSLQRKDEEEEEDDAGVVMVESGGVSGSTKPLQHPSWCPSIQPLPKGQTQEEENHPSNSISERRRRIGGASRVR